MFVNIEPKKEYTYLSLSNCHMKSERWRLSSLAPPSLFVDVDVLLFSYSKDDQDQRIDNI